MSAACERSMELYRYIRTPDCSPAEVERLWRQVFEAVLMRERFTRKAIDYMWDNLAQGNWKHMHQAEAERAMTADEWLEAFSGDVFYCSDRWSLDRLTRCHWTWRQYKRKVVGE